MEFDLQGRIDNMRLPDGKAAILYSVYEAVSNAIHACQERFGVNECAKQGKIDVRITTDRESKLIDKIVVKDNGIGLNDKNLKSFNTCDSRTKRDIGGKGVGRLIWLKVFKNVLVESIYNENKTDIRNVSFQFVVDQKDTLKDLKKSGAQGELGTVISFSDIGEEHNSSIRSDTFTKDLSLHFFSYFLSGLMPRLIIHHNDTTPINLIEYMQDRIRSSTSEEFAINELSPSEKLTITHIYVERTLPANLKNSVLYVADHRLVERQEIETKYALDSLNEEIAYVALVSGPFLDKRSDQERTGFKLSKKQMKILEEAIFEKIDDFLKDHIGEVKKTQKVVIGQLLMEHPQLAQKVPNVDEYVKTLAPSMGEEEIGKTLFTLLYREEKKISAEIARLEKSTNLNEEVEKSYKSLMPRIEQQMANRLAEYVVKRHQILELLKTFLKFKEGTENHHYEKAIHDLICPMGEFYSNHEYDKHNLWIIDDLLAFYSFFASDKQIQSFVEKGNDRSEPDIIFVNPMGFDRSGTVDPIVLVEFKRPGDERTTGSPIDQVLEYIEKLRDKTVKRPDGELVPITKDTPFVCYVICDLTEGTKRLVERSSASNLTPDGKGYYGYAPNHKATIHVISYSKMLKDAQLRNKIFFDRLNLQVV